MQRSYTDNSQMTYSKPCTTQPDDDTRTQAQCTNVNYCTTCTTRTLTTTDIGTTPNRSPDGHRPGQQQRQAQEIGSGRTITTDVETQTNTNRSPPNESHGVQAPGRNTRTGKIQARDCPAQAAPAIQAPSRRHKASLAGEKPRIPPGIAIPRLESAAPLGV